MYSRGVPGPGSREEYYTGQSYYPREEDSMVIHGSRKEDSMVIHGSREEEESGLFTARGKSGISPFCHFYHFCSEYCANALRTTKNDHFGPLFGLLLDHFCTPFAPRCRPGPRVRAGRNKVSLGGLWT